MTFCYSYLSFISNLSVLCQELHFIYSAYLKEGAFKTHTHTHRLMEKQPVQLYSFEFCNIVLMFV